MAHVFRCYTEKRDGFDVEAKALLKDLTGTLGVTNLTGVRLFNRYDAEGIDEATTGQPAAVCFPNRSATSVMMKNCPRCRKDPPFWLWNSARPIRPARATPALSASR